MRVLTAGAGAPGGLLCVLFLLFSGFAHGATVPSYPWSIKGTPPKTATAGFWYNFRPTALVTGVPTRYFIIENKPAWATFDRSTGLLIGKPMNAHAGTYKNVKISITDGVLKMPLAPFSITVHASAAGVS